MSVDEIITSLATNNSQLERCRENIAGWRTTIRRLEREIAEEKECLRTCVEDEADLLAKRSRLLGQLKAALTEDNPKSTEQIIEPNQTESDKPQDDDDVYHLVRRPVQIDGVRWAKDADRTLMVTVTDNETHKQQQLFTDNEPCIKTCIAGLGNIVDVEYDENSGELISMIVGE